MNRKPHKNRDSVDRLLGSDLNAEAAWSEFNTKERNRRPLLFLIFGSLFASCVLAVCIFSTDMPFENIVSEVDIVHRSQSKQVGTTEIVTSSKNTLSTEQKNSTSVNTTEYIPQQEMGDANEKGNQLSIETKSTIEQENQTAVSLQTNAVTYKSTNDTEILNENPKLKLIESQAKQDQDDTVVTETLNTDLHEKHADPKEETLASDKKSSITSQSRKVFYSPAVAEEDKRIKLFNQIPVIANNQITKVGSSQIITAIPPIVTLKKERLHRTSISLYSGLAAISRTMRFAEQDILQKRRKENEQLLYRQSIGLLFNMKMKNEFSLSAGLEYSNYITHIKDVIQTNVSIEERNDVLVAYKIRAGVSTPVFATADTRNVEITEKTRFQEYRSVSIPISISYTYAVSPRYNIIIGTGLAYHLMMSPKGLTYSSIESIGDYSPISDFDYKSKHLMEGSLHARLQTHLTRSIAVGLGANYQADLNSRTLKSSRFSDRFSSFGIQLYLTKNL